MDNNDYKEYEPFQQYQTQQTTQMPPRQPYLEPHRGTLVLVFGIVGTIFCVIFGILAWIFGILAWIFGNEDLKKMDSGRMDPSGRNLTNVGRILGIISVCLSILGILVTIIYFVFLAGLIVGALQNGF